jgi:hypothetical protein
VEQQSFLICEYRSLPAAAGSVRHFNSLVARPQTPSRHSTLEHFVEKWEPLFDGKGGCETNLRASRYRLKTTKFSANLRLAWRGDSGVVVAAQEREPISGTGPVTPSAIEAVGAQAYAVTLTSGVWRS